MVISYTKSFEVKPQLDHHLTLNLKQSFSVVTFLFEDASISKQRMRQLVRNALNFLSHVSHMISWDINKSHDFQTLFVFYTILKQFDHKFMVMFRGQTCSKFSITSRIRPHIKLNNMNIIFFIHFIALFGGRTAPKH